MAPSSPEMEFPMKKPIEEKQEQAKPAPKQKMTAEDCKRIGLDPSVYGLKAE